jgi:hypothetical protein
MLRINEFNLEPGPYVDSKGFTVVVTDVVNHRLDPVHQLPDVMPEPYVICRDLIPPPEHRVYMIELTYFNHHFFPK